MTLGEFLEEIKWLKEDPDNIDLNQDTPMVFSDENFCVFDIENVIYDDETNELQLDVYENMGEH